MRVIKVAANIRMILVIDDDSPNPAWLKKRLENIQGVASAQVDGYITEDIISVALGPQQPKKEG